MSAGYSEGRMEENVSLLVVVEKQLADLIMLGK